MRAGSWTSSPSSTGWVGSVAPSGAVDRRLPVLPREQHRQRARREGGIGDDESSTGCGAAPRSREVRQRRIAHGRRGAHDPLQLRHGVLIDLGDRGAGEDVVELVEQERLPGGFDLIVRVGEPGELRDGREGFGFEEPVLAGAVERFRAGLGRQRAAVELQVELAHPDRQTRFRQRGEILLDVRHAQARQRRELLDARVVLEHARRSARRRHHPSRRRAGSPGGGACRRSCARCRGCRAGRCCRCSRGPATDCGTCWPSPGCRRSLPR